MIGRLIPLRLLRSSGAFRGPRGGAAAPSLLRSEASSRTSNPFFRGDYCTGTRFLSGLSRRPRSGTGGGPLRGGRDVEVRSRGAAAGQAKSLIEDEEELSDWISDIKKDSFRLGLSSDDDEDSDRGRPKDGRGRSGGRDSDNFRSGSRKGDSFGSRSKASTSRRMDDDSDDFTDFSNRGMSQSSRGGSSSRRIPARRQMEDVSNDFSESFRKGTPRGSRGSSSKRASTRRQMDDDSEDNLLDLSDRLNTGSSPRYSSKKRFDSESEDDYDDHEDDDELGMSSKKTKNVGTRGGTLPRSARKGGKDIETRNKSLKGASFPVSFPDDQEIEQDEDEDDSDFDDDFFGDEGNDKEKAFQDVFKSFSSHESDKGDGEQPALTKATGEDSSYLSQTRFEDCSISPLTLRGIKAAGYERMTVVQEATLPVILKGKDVLAKARTGTGKTVAFLLPAIEVVSKLPPVDRDNKRPPINVLVVCPTRELADQAAAEANMLVKYHPSLGVQVIMGGTRLALEQKRLQTSPCQLLVATPGRLRDHIENTPGFATRLMGVKFLVLDEADRLLDMGFRKDIEKIVAAVPKQRQTLLFSATVPDEVREICYVAMKRDLEFINTVEEGAEETHSQVKQMHLVAPLEKQFSLLYKMLSDHICDNVDYKVIVFCTTAMVTRFVAELLSELKLNIREIHSRKPQSYRTRVSKEFKESKGLILVSSDVSARGVDYPNVTLVIQLGVPADREQYIHRLGRTGRKGKEGTGILMLAPWEDSFLGSIKDLPITKAPSIQVDPDIAKKVQRALAHVELKNKESAYQAWLGYYNSNRQVGRDKYQLVSLANEFSRSMGLDNPPAISTVVLRKMGLNNVPGLRAK